MVITTSYAEEDVLMEQPSLSRRSSSLLTRKKSFEGIQVVVAETLEHLCKSNQMRAVVPDETENASLFYARTEQSFALEWYVERLLNNAACSRSAFVVALIYLKRVQEMGREKYFVVSRNVHRLFLTALVLAIKFLDEPIYDNLFYARVGGLGSLREMNTLEAEMLRLLDFRVFVSDEEYDYIKSILISS